MFSELSINGLVDWMYSLKWNEADVLVPKTERTQPLFGGVAFPNLTDLNNGIRFLSVASSHNNTTNIVQNTTDPVNPDTKHNDENKSCPTEAFRYDTDAMLPV